MSTINAGRVDYDYILKAPNLLPGEPIFFLRGRDPAARAGVIGWAVEAHELGTSLAIIESGLRQGDRMAAFQPKRLAGGADYTDAERKQLEYQFSRRAWGRRDDAVADPEALLLATQRGWDAAMARVRRGEVA